LEKLFFTHARARARARTHTLTKLRRRHDEMITKLRGDITKSLETTALRGETKCHAHTKQ